MRHIKFFILNKHRELIYHLNKQSFQAISKFPKKDQSQDPPKSLIDRLDIIWMKLFRMRIIGMRFSSSVKVLDLDGIQELHGVNFLIKQLEMLSFFPIQSQT